MAKLVNVPALLQRIMFTTFNLINSLILNPGIMIELTTFPYGPVHFSRVRTDEAGRMHGLILPGSQMFAADVSYGKISFQHLEQPSCHIYRYNLLLNEKITLYINNAVAWPVLRLALKRGMVHVMHKKNKIMRWGQLNFSYTPQTMHSFRLPEGTFEIIELYISPSLVSALAGKSNILRTFARHMQKREEVFLLPDAWWGDLKLLDAVDWLLQHPHGEQPPEVVMNSVVEAAGSPVYHIPHITDRHLEKLFLTRDIIKKNCTTHIMNEKLAKAAHMNVTYFKNMFRQLFRMTPYQYRLYEQLKHARSLIEDNPSLSNTEVAQLSGFGSYNNLQRLFLKKQGTTLSSWRKARNLHSWLLT